MIRINKAGKAVLTLSVEEIDRVLSCAYSCVWERNGCADFCELTADLRDTLNDLQKSRVPKPEEIKNSWIIQETLDLAKLVRGK